MGQESFRVDAEGNVHEVTDKEIEGERKKEQGLSSAYLQLQLSMKRNENQRLREKVEELQKEIELLKKRNN